MQNPVSIASAIIGLTAIIVSWRVYAYQRRQNQFALALALHQDLTKGEVAMARHVIDVLWYGEEPTRGQITYNEALTAYFTVLWCFERIRAGDRTMRAHSRRLRSSNKATSPALDFMYDMIHWHVREWSSYIEDIRNLLVDRFGGDPGDKYSRVALTELAEILAAAGYPTRDLKERGSRSTPNGESGDGV